MSALDDIGHALHRCPPKRPGWARCVFVGPSAAFSIEAHLKAEKMDDSGFPVRINGAQVQRTEDFLGWRIRDLDSNAKWHDVELAA